MPIPLRVLIVEDSLDDAEMMVLHLTDERFQPEWRRVQTEADYLAVLETNPDLILADWSLPQFSGLRALQLMKTRGLDIPFLVVSGSIGEEAAVEAMHQGVADYLLKDRLARLGQAVRRSLEDKQLREDRRRAEDALRESQARLQHIIDVSPTVIYTTTPDFAALWVSKNVEATLGYTVAESLAPGWWADHLHPDDRQRVITRMQHLLEIGEYSHEYRFQFKDGSYRWIHDELRLIRDAQGNSAEIVGSWHDITERKQAEEALRHRLAELEALHTVSAALGTAQTRDEALPILLDEMLAALETSAGMIWLYYPDRDELQAAVARGWFSQLSETPIKPGEGIAGTVFASGQAYLSTEFRSDPLAIDTTRTKIPAGWGGACVPVRSGVVAVGVLFVSVPPPNRITTEHVRLLESLAEIGGAALHRMSLHEETIRQLDQLKSLHDIDLVITSSIDLRVTLNILILHVLTQLKVDAANVLLLNPHLQTLEFAAGHGFRTDALKNTRLRLGEGYAGRAALERKFVHIPDLRGRMTDFLRSPFFSTEGFVAYFGVPLIAKEQVKGVLEIFHRTPLAAKPDWVNLLETVAGQAAIAIDNAQLFSDLQHSNVELALAYDATIEGWSRALDLRDKETEGHTLRVTKLTEDLARAMGLSDTELVHMRRGALLHDIGKMGIPDQILLKPGELTDEEWKTIRRHPLFAYEMLSPITYLLPALDIPYCHHEKWDGSGYPRGLKGEEIPLHARLFAIVDVWDALINDRPYRKAWPIDKTLAYIREQSGKHFDPQVVQAFLKIMSTLYQ